MSITEVERRLAPVLYYDPASVGKTAAAVGRRRGGCRVWRGTLEREESRAENCGDKKLCRASCRALPAMAASKRLKNAAERESANRARQEFTAGPARGRRAAIFSPSSRPANAAMPQESLAVSLRATRSKMIMAFRAKFHAPESLRAAVARADLRPGEVSPSLAPEPHEIRAKLSGASHAIGAPARPAGVRRPAHSISCSSRPLPRSRPFARWDASSPRS